YTLSIPEFNKPPKIDGRLDNLLWMQGAVIDKFTQYEPVEGKEPSERTVAYIGYDKDNLYIAIHCFDSNPKAVRACLTQRDKVENDDEVSVYLDTFNDKKRAFVFQVNACGVQTDGMYIESRRRRRGDGGPDRIDKTWDTFFITNAYLNEEGYIIEMSIPFKSIRFPNSNNQIWGFQIKRNIRRKNEEIYWHPRSRDVNGFLVQSGTIRIDGQLNKGKNLEIMPVVTGVKEMQAKIDPEAGLNMKYGITSNLTADATFNPDFSQIEADMPQIEVNQRYEIYYPEKRPFFLEGKDFFDTPFELVYTRTISDPQWGTKLSGKMGKTTLGFLSTYDFNTTIIRTPFDEEDDEEEDDEPAQRGLVNVFRLKQDLFPESYIGLIFTDKEMALPGQPITSNFNRVVGVDGHFKFLDQYRFSFQVVGSQTKKNDYESGFVPAMMFNLNRQGRHLHISAEYTHIPPDFEASTGFFERKDIRSFKTRLSYAFLPMTDVLVDIRPSIEYKRIYDFGNFLTDEELRFGFFASGWRGTYMWGGFGFSTERYEGVEYRKKGLMMSLGSNPLAFLSGRITFGVGDGIYYDDNHYLGFKYSYGFELNLRPMTNLLLSYNFTNDTFYKSRGGELEYAINLISQRIIYQISRHLSLRLITDYNDYDKALYNSILLSYELVPGTVFYIGMDDNQTRLERDRYAIEGRFIFVKFSYWWRI
ncbi:MAG: carbohydrate binding family 9 domain-containing protein, partial [Candidatus Aminicenantes bacterium]|nr:carbohydrate binding family 9 domain-containing protein [Candidatus Aminicenantes bacterium]